MERLPDTVGGAAGAHDGWVSVSDNQVLSVFDNQVPSLSDDWLVTLSEVARELQAEHPSTDRAADNIAAVAVKLLPGVDLATVAVVARDQSITTVGAVDPTLQRLHEVQQLTHDGPVPSAVHQCPTVLVADVTTDRRWPECLRAARELGIAAILSLRLYVSERTLGALTLYSRTSGQLTDDVVGFARAYAAHAAVAFDSARERDNLREAITSRDRIGQAKGILMERHKMTDEQAFAVLVRTSQHLNKPVRTIVDELTRSGDLPTPPRRRG